MIYSVYYKTYSYACTHGLLIVVENIHLQTRNEYKVNRGNYYWRNQCARLSTPSDYYYYYYSYILWTN